MLTFKIKLLKTLLLHTYFDAFYIFEVYFYNKVPPFKVSNSPHFWPCSEERSLQFSYILRARSCIIGLWLKVNNRNFTYDFTIYFT